jgi:hypothetical protein
MYITLLALIHPIAMQFTMLAMKSMASGPPVDMQREARWPSQEAQINPRGTKSVSVEWEPHQIDSDFDEVGMEDIFPPAAGGGPIVDEEQ